MKDADRTSKQIAFDTLIRNLRVAGEHEVGPKGRVYWIAADLAHELNCSVDTLAAILAYLEGWLQSSEDRTSFRKEVAKLIKPVRKDE